MNPLSFLLIVTAVLISASAQLILKIGMSGGYVAQALARNQARDIVASIITSPYVVGGLFLYGVGAIVWLFVLAKQDLSLAYPFVGLGFIVTMFFGLFVLGEHLTASRIAGTLLICVGCALIARTA